MLILLLPLIVHFSSFIIFAIDFFMIFYFHLCFMYHSQTSDAYVIFFCRFAYGIRNEKTSLLL